MGRRAFIFLVLVAWQCGIVACFSARRLGYVNVLDFSRKLVPYQTAWNWQKRLVDHHVMLQDQESDIQHEDAHTEQCVGTLLLLQHEHVYTLGSATDPQTSGPFSRTDASGEELSYETVEVDRGGQATYHGPGQLVVYPILDLTHFDRDIHGYLRRIEETLLRLLKQDFALSAHRIDGLTGVWVQRPDVTHADKALSPATSVKVAALGVHLRRWVTSHGLSLNVHPDRRYFHNIRPCGLTAESVGSLCDFFPNQQLSVSDVAELYLKQFASIWNINMRSISSDVNSHGKRLESVYEDILKDVAALPAQSSAG